MIKLLNAIIIVLVLILVAIIVYPQWKENRPISVRIGCDSTVNTTAFVVTQEKQFFKNERITPEFVFFSDPQVMLDSLTAGTIHCAVVPWCALLKRVDVSQDSYKVLASGEFRTSIPIDGLLISPTAKTKIKDIKDLKNKRLGYPTQVKELMPVVLNGMNIKPNEIKLVEMSNTALVAALLSNQVDAILVLEPERTAGLNQGLAALIEPVLPKYVCAPFPGVAYTITPTLIAKQNRIAYKLKLLMDGTVAFVDANVEESRAMFIDFYKLDKDIYNNCYLPQFQKMIEINKGSVVSMMSKMFDSGVLSKSYDIQMLFAEPSQFKQ